MSDALKFALDGLLLLGGLSLCWSGWFVLLFVYFRYKMQAPRSTARVFAIIFGSLVFLVYVVFFSMRPFAQGADHALQNNLLLAAIVTSLLFPYGWAVWIYRRHVSPPDANPPQSFSPPG